MTPKTQELYKAWLINNRKVTQRVAGNYVSRCKTIENRLGVQLDEYLTDSDSLESLIQQIEAEYRPNLASDYKNVVRRFFQFRFPNRKV